MPQHAYRKAGGKLAEYKRYAGCSKSAMPSALFFDDDLIPS